MGWVSGVADPFSLAALGAVAISEGIKFVYAQATEVLKRRRERKATGVDPTEPIPIEHGEVLDGPLKPPKPDYEILESLQERVTALAVELSKYRDGLVEPPPETVETVNELRKALEAIYGQRITFKGEKGRENTGTTISGEIRAKLVKGTAIAVDVERVSDGATVDGITYVDTVDAEGSAIGVRAKDVRG
jgi:hypothetical protein